MRFLSVLFTLIWIVGALFSIGCVNLPQSSDQTVEGVTIMLVGKWQKISDTSCSQTYPDNIEFRPRGTYIGQRGLTGQDFTLWDAGTYQVTSENYIQLSIATDAIRQYEFEIAGDMLTFWDQDRSQLQYRKEKRNKLT